MCIFALIAAMAVAACERADDTDGTEAPGTSDESEASENATDNTEENPTAATDGATSVDHTDPSAVVQAMLDVATSNDWAQLGGLCDPDGGNDGDTQRICNLATDAEDRAEFIEVFRGGTLNGAARISGDTAVVPFVFGVTDRNAEEMRLVQRDGRWYLASF
jgi:hypothetical protein